jgi:signal transduction histidine kinase
LFLILALFATVPAVILTTAWGGAVAELLPLMAGQAAWDSASSTGERALEVARRGARTASDSEQVVAHERALANSATMARRFQLLTARTPQALIFISIVLLVLLVYGAARVAGHLSRQLSRPLDELVAWTGRIARGEPLPPSDTRGAPEFDVLRDGMRQMATDLEAGRRAAIESERLATLRESARQVAHELKNPLTPIRFAVARLRGRVADDLADAVAVIDTESARLDQMARSFAQFGRLPDGPVAEVDVRELVDAAVRSAIPLGFRCDVRVASDLPRMDGQHDALGRALGNVLVNAVEACGPSGQVTIEAVRGVLGDRPAVAILVRDNGPGLDAAKLGAIWEPYVTHKPGGTGLGLAIVRQTVAAHGGTVAADSAPGAGMTITLTLPGAGPSEESR